MVALFGEGIPATNYPATRCIAYAIYRLGSSLASFPIEEIKSRPAIKMREFVIYWRKKDEMKLGILIQEIVRCVDFKSPTLPVVAIIFVLRDYGVVSCRCVSFREFRENYKTINVHYSLRYSKRASSKRLEALNIESINL